MVTAYCYDPLYLEHDLPDHPENRARLEHIMRQLAADGLLERMVQVPAQPVSMAALARVHAGAQISMVRRLAELGGGDLEPDTYVGPRSYAAALLAAGGCVEVVRAVLGGQPHNGIALVRPPGHHATAQRSMGFCLFNNIAVAARVALDDYDLERVLIVDWDVHHGNGTQDIFYCSPQVLFFSTHQYPYYPGSGDWRERGAGAGEGYTVNVPLGAGVGDEGFARIYDQLLVPLAERYQPQLILVSAGYDAHWNDPLADLRLSLDGYRHIARVVVDLSSRLCAGRVVVILEGGYNLQVLAHGVASTCRALLGDDTVVADPLGPAPQPSRPINQLLRMLRQANGLAD